MALWQNPPNQVANCYNWNRVTEVAQNQQCFLCPQGQIPAPQVCSCYANFDDKIITSHTESDEILFNFVVEKKDVTLYN